MPTSHSSLENKPAPQQTRPDPTTRPDQTRPSNRPDQHQTKPETHPSRPDSPSDQTRPDQTKPKTRPPTRPDYDHHQTRCATAASLDPEAYSLTPASCYFPGVSFPCWRQPPPEQTTTRPYQNQTKRDQTTPPLEPEQNTQQNPVQHPDQSRPPPDQTMTITRPDAQPASIDPETYWPQLSGGMQRDPMLATAPSRTDRHQTSSKQNLTT